MNRTVWFYAVEIEDNNVADARLLRFATARECDEHILASENRMQGGWPVPVDHFTFECRDVIAISIPAPVEQT